MPRPAESLGPEQDAAEAELMTRMQLAISETIEIWDQPGSIKIEAADKVHFHFVYSLAAHAIEQVKAARILIDAELSFPAETNGRSAFEHAMTAQWVLHTADAEQAVHAEMYRQQSKTIRDFKFLTDVGQELSDFADNTPVSAGGPARSFEQLCRRFSPNQGLYSMYRMLTNSVHPSFATMERHLEVDDDGVHALRQDSNSAPPVDLLRALAMATMFSVSAVEAMRHGQPKLAELHAIAARYDLPRDLSGDDSSPQLGRPARPESD